MQSIWVVAGTRPEIVKLAPVYRALLARAPMPVRWVTTGQHTDLAEQALADFAITPDVRLALPRSKAIDTRAAQAAPDSVAVTLANLIRAVDRALAHHRPRLVVVQGDTTSTLATALAAFSRRIPIAHVEAGLRSFDLAHPFPEEAWRSIVSQVARFHFAPTEKAARNLKAAGVAGDIHVTGNTVIDALHWLMAQDDVPAASGVAHAPLVTVTLHRRENWDEAFAKVCAALVALADQRPEIEICFVAHANPALRDAAMRALGGRPRIRVVPPMGYGAFIRLLRSSKLVLSDSGGIQEEAPALGVPVLVLRETTERPEAVEAGVAKLVGTDPARILVEAARLLGDESAYRRMARRVSPFGDGKASNRIADAIAVFLARETGDRRSVA